jgi:hypothetical protein
LAANRHLQAIEIWKSTRRTGTHFCLHFPDVEKFYFSSIRLRNFAISSGVVLQHPPTRIDSQSPLCRALSTIPINVSSHDIYFRVSTLYPLQIVNFNSPHLSRFLQSSPIPS